MSGYSTVFSVEYRKRMCVVSKCYFYCSILRTTLSNSFSPLHMPPTHLQFDKQHWQFGKSLKASPLKIKLKGLDMPSTESGTCSLNWICSHTGLKHREQLDTFSEVFENQAVCGSYFTWEKHSNRISFVVKFYSKCFY